MQHKPLSETNPYLQDKNAYKNYLFTNVTTSATIELGSMSAEIKKALKAKRSPVFIYLSPEIEKDFSQ